jgi:hypothetical protein
MHGATALAEAIISLSALQSLDFRCAICQLFFWNDLPSLKFRGRNCGVGDAGSMALGNAMAGLTGLAVLATVNGWDKLRGLRNGEKGNSKVDLHGTELVVPVARYLPLSKGELTDLNVRLEL